MMMKFFKSFNFIRLAFIWTFYGVYVSHLIVAGEDLTTKGLIFCLFFIILHHLVIIKIKCDFDKRVYYINKANEYFKDKLKSANIDRAELLKISELIKEARNHVIEISGMKDITDINVFEHALEEDQLTLDAR